MVTCIVFTSCNQSDKQQNVESTTEFINQNDINRIEPPNWWVGFKSDSLQLLIHHEDISNYKPSINYKGVTIKNVSKGNNSANYLFIDLSMSESTSPGTFNIKFTNDNNDELIAHLRIKNT